MRCTSFLALTSGIVALSCHGGAGSSGDPATGASTDTQSVLDTNAAGDTNGDSAAEAPSRPNIVLIMADDMGFSDLGCFGSEILTPNLDSLAANGLRFTQLYNSARCSPTRASLMTGLYAHQVGVGWMVSDTWEEVREALDSPAYTDHLSMESVTMAEVLAQAGYHTLMSGKWGIGETGLSNYPVSRGFQRSFYLTPGYSSYWVPEDGKLWLDDQVWENDYGEFYITDVFTDFALQFVDEVYWDDDPFFLYLAYTAPHWPLHAYEADYEKYQGQYLARGGWQPLRQERYQAMKAMGVLDERWALSDADYKVEDWQQVDQVDMDLRMSVYAAQIQRMDQNVGRLVEHLESLGLLEDTLLVFLSDNGACQEDIDEDNPAPVGSADSWLSYHRSWANASNTPFRWYKHQVHEGGIRAPTIVHWPAGMKTTGIFVGELADVMDLAPTFYDVAGATYPETYEGREIPPLEGRSLLPTLLGQERKGYDYIAFEHQGNRALRMGDWKIVSLEYGQAWELYDMDADGTETNDLSGEYPDKVGEMETIYQEWAERFDVASPEEWLEAMSKRNH